LKVSMSDCCLLWEHLYIDGGEDEVIFARCHRCGMRFEMDQYHQLKREYIRQLTGELRAYRKLFKQCRGFLSQWYTNQYLEEFENDIRNL